MSNLITTVKIKVAEIAAADLSKKADKGELGTFAQRAYRASKGYKSVIGAALFLIIQALGLYTPPSYDCYVRYLSIASGVLIAIGLLDKARRNEPIFEPWFLEALARISAWVAAASTSILAFASGGMLDLLFPGHPGLADQVVLITTAVTTATAFVNRLATASAAKPTPAVESAQPQPK